MSDSKKCFVYFILFDHFINSCLYYKRWSCPLVHWPQIHLDRPYKHQYLTAMDSLPIHTTLPAVHPEGTWYYLYTHVHSFLELTFLSGVAKVHHTLQKLNKNKMKKIKMKWYKQFRYVGKPQNIIGLSTFVLLQPQKFF